MINLWTVLIFGIVLGVFLGYASSFLMPQDITGYAVVAAMVLMLILSRLSSPRRTRKMPYNKVVFLNLLSGIVFGYGIVLLFLFIASG